VGASLSSSGAALGAGPEGPAPRRRWRETCLPDRTESLRLTTIALCLVWLCVMLTPTGTPLSAQTSVQDVRIVSIKEPAVRRVTELGKPIRELREAEWDQLPTTN
jgi:hypothetical protein